MARIDVYVTTILSNPGIRGRHERVVRYLTSARVPYQMHDVASDEQAKLFWRRKDSTNELPCVLVDGERVGVSQLSCNELSGPSCYSFGHWSCRLGRHELTLGCLSQSFADLDEAWVTSQGMYRTLANPSALQCRIRRASSSQSHLRSRPHT